jgi:hypothetical protein
VDDCTLGVATLPVEMTSFKAEIENNEIIVSWVTLSEINNSHFEVLLGSYLVEFTLVKTIIGNGSSYETIKYTNRFASELSGIIYVKLRQVNFNGDYVDSKVLALNHEPDFSIKAVKLYPNPSRNFISFTNLKHDENYQLVIYSVDGELIQSSSISSVNNKIDISRIEFGSYIVKITDDFSNQYSIRFFKI